MSIFRVVDTQDVSARGNVLGTLLVMDIMTDNDEQTKWKGRLIQGHTDDEKNKMFHS